MKTVIFIFNVRWPLLLKKWSLPPKFFPPFSPKMLLFSKKLFNEKIFKISVPILKKRLYSFSSPETPFPLSPRNSFSRFSQKIQLFLEKLLNNKIFNALFVIKKSYVNFWRKAPFSLKNSQMRRQNSSFTVFSENTAFFEKIVE